MKLIRYMVLVGLAFCVATSGLLMAPSDLRAQEDEYRATGVPSGGIGAGRNFGIGLGWGTFAAGLTGKYYLTSASALQAHLGLGADFDGLEGFGFNLDYVLEPGALVTSGAGSLVWGIGAGGAVFGDGNSGGVAVNGVAEIGWQFSPVPIEIMLDYRPYFAVGNRGAGLGLFFPLGLSGRYFF